MNSGRWRTWRTAMADALYGEEGFYRRPGAPGAHFRTSAHASPLWATAVLRLAERVSAEVAGRFTVVDMGAGGGELLEALAGQAPQQWQLIGVDVCPRPEALASRVQWRAELPERIEGLLIAVEWLDVVPVDVVELTDEGPRLVEVSSDGAERVGAALDDSDTSWLAQWWPLADVGDRAEVGQPRDAAWAQAVSRLSRGVAVAVDYAADPGRDVAGTLTGYVEGRQIVPVPDGSCDITAHVLMQSCAAAVADCEGRLISQREALRALGVAAARPSYDGTPLDYLTALQAAGEAAELLDPNGLGAFTWLVQAKGVPLPL